MRRWLLVLAGLSFLAAALFWFLGYHPALMAAPGYTLHNVTDPGWLNGRIKTFQAIAEQTPCTYQLLGWQETDTLYYEASCAGTSHTWRYTVAVDTSERVAAAPSGLYVEPVPATSIINGVLADVRPRELATVSREVFIAGDALPAPDGRFTALVSRHVYGPQDVLLLAPGIPPSPTAQLAAATATETAVPPAYPMPATAYPSPTTPTPDTLHLPPEVSKPPLPTRPPSPTSTPIWGDARPQAPPAGLVIIDPEGLWQITAGGQKRQLWTRSPVTLSPDGQRALYQDEESLLIVDLTTGAESVLDLSGYDEWCCAVWGGNEMILLGTLPEGEEREQSFGYLTAVSLDGGWQKALDPAEKFGTYPALSPDGRTVAYGMARLVHLDGSIETFDPFVFAGFPQVEHVGLGSPAWSPDGAKLAWYIAGNIGVGGNWAAAVAVFDLGTETAVVLPPYPNLGRDGWFDPPVWSPDGRWLAFVAEAANIPQNGVWVAAADGSEEHFLGGTGGNNLVWSPDGRYLAYTVFDLVAEQHVALLADTETWTAVPLDLPANARVVYWSEAEDVSPNGQWRVSTEVSDPTPPEDDEAGQFPNGKYHVEMVVARADGSQTWTAVDEWRPWGLGYTVPQPVRWSEDGRYFYFANVPVPDGCASLVNGGDLWRLDLISGKVTEIAPYIGLTMALSPDETKLAVDASYGRGFLIHDLEAGNEQPIPLPQPDGRWQISGLQWSPDGRYLLLLQAINPCSPETETAVVHIDVASLTASVILGPDGRQFTLWDWPENDAARLQDSKGRTWHLNPFSGELLAGD